MEDWSPRQQTAVLIAFVVGSIAFLYVGLAWLDLGLRRAVDLHIVTMMALGMLACVYWLVRYRTRPTTAIRGFVVEGEYRGVAGFVYAFHIFVEHLSSFYGYGRGGIDSVTFGFMMFAGGIWLAHHAAENWSRPDRRVDC